VLLQLLEEALEKSLRDMIADQRKAASLGCKCATQRATRPGGQRGP
jgi:hypothetical protein